MIFRGNKQPGLAQARREFWRGDFAGANGPAGKAPPRVIGDQQFATVIDGKRGDLQLSVGQLPQRFHARAVVARAPDFCRSNSRHKHRRR